MENKKTFGAFILRRRKELGMTQREFAEQLFVTESAVSKWERGMSYPDITLLQNICSVLEITEDELLNGGEDTKRRNSEKLAEKYQRLTQNYRRAQYIFYGLILLSCAIGNVASVHTLDWFFIVLASVGMAASLTLVPALADTQPRFEHYKAVLAFVSFLACLELLLLVCCLHTGGDWFWVAAVAVLFGVLLIALPLLLPALPLPGWAARRKATIYLCTETVLLLLLLLVCCLYTKGDWFIMAAVSVVFGLGLFILPVILKQVLREQPLYFHKALLYFAIETGLFVLLLVVADIYTGAGVLFSISLPTAAICLTLPWGIMLLIRYLPVNGWFCGSACFAWTGLWLWLSPFIFDKMMEVYYGESAQPYRLFWKLDFFTWGGSQTVYNVLGIILLSLGGIAVFLAAVGWIRRGKVRGNAD